jgi:hypothetical protein
MQPSRNECNGTGVAVEVVEATLESGSLKISWGMRRESVARRRAPSRNCEWQ